MLYLTRKPGQALTIRPERNLDLATPVGLLFENGPICIRVASVRGKLVQLGVTADTRLTILRDELVVHTGTGPLPADVRAMLGRKLRLLRFMRKLSAALLAESAGVALTTVLAAERGAGVVDIDDLEKLATALGVPVVELLREPGATPEERVMLALLREI